MKDGNPASVLPVIAAAVAIFSSDDDGDEDIIRNRRPRMYDALIRQFLEIAPEKRQLSASCKITLSYYNNADFALLSYPGTQTSGPESLPHYEHQRINFLRR